MADVAFESSTQVSLESAASILSALFSFHCFSEMPFGENSFLKQSKWPENHLAVEPACILFPSPSVSVQCLLVHYVGLTPSHETSSMSHCWTTPLMATIFLLSFLPQKKDPWLDLTYQRLLLLSETLVGTAEFVLLLRKPSMFVCNFMCIGLFLYSRTVRTFELLTVLNAKGCSGFLLHCTW